MHETKDSVVRGILELPNLRVVVAVTTMTAREARHRHRMAPVSASLAAQGITGGVLLSALQKGDTRTNLQLECDGPFRGFFVEGATNGDVRAYAKNSTLDIELAEGPYKWRAALGNSGFLSVLRDIGEEYYRSSVALIDMNVASDLNHYFATSDQVASHVSIEVVPRGDEKLGVVAGVLIQALPEGNVETLNALRQQIPQQLVSALSNTPEVTAEVLAELLFPQMTKLNSVPVRFHCTCNKQRVIDTLATLGVTEIQHIVDTMGSTAVTCQFCAEKHEVALPDLLELLEKLGAPIAQS